MFSLRQLCKRIVTEEQTIVVDMDATSQEVILQYSQQELSFFNRFKTCKERVTRDNEW